MVRLICLAEAAEQASGAAVNTGRKLARQEVWSCALMVAKSKLMKGTVPRNELSAILLMTELAFIVKKSLGEQVDKIIYVTDSMIASHWRQNTNKRLRSYVLSRVNLARRMIQWTLDCELIPLFHIDGNSNLADLLTKPWTRLG